MKLKHSIAIALFAAAAAFTFFSCQKNIAPAAAPQDASLARASLSSTGGSYLSNLLAYKNSPHHPFYAWLSGDSAAKDLLNMPDSVDFVDVQNNPVDSAHWTIAQGKGMRLLIYHWISDAYFDGASTDPLKGATGYKKPSNYNTTKPNNTNSYHHLAQAWYNQIVGTWKLDGVDVDIEAGTFFGTVLTVANGDSVLTALAQYFGPNCTKCSVPTAGPASGKKPLFFYDTDGSMNDKEMYGKYAANYDYVPFQAYSTVSGMYNTGITTASFPSLEKTYGVNKLLYMSEGEYFSAYQPGVAPAAEDGSMLNFAQWIAGNRAGNQCGVAAYNGGADCGTHAAIFSLHQAGHRDHEPCCCNHYLVPSVNNSNSKTIITPKSVFFIFPRRRCAGVTANAYFLGNIVANGNHTVISPSPRLAQSQ